MFVEEFIVSFEGIFSYGGVGEDVDVEGIEEIIYIVYGLYIERVVEVVFFREFDVRVVLRYVERIDGECGLWFDVCGVWCDGG